MANNEQHYQWQGMDPRGKRVSGVIQATDSKNAQSELNKRGIEIISLSPKRKLFSRTKKITAKDILLFTRYLSTLLTAGLSIVQTLDIIARDQDNPAMQALVISLKNDIASGKVLAESFSKHPESFSKLYVSLIKAGERAGLLEKMLKRMASYLERTEGLKRKVKKALMYPTVVIAIAIIVSLVLLIFAVPQFQAMFATFGAKLPFFTRMIVSLSDFFRGYWWVIVLLIFSIIAVIRFSIKQSDYIPEKYDKWILRAPVIGSMMQKSIIARFTRTLATTLEAGMPLIESMRTMPEIMGNRVYGRAIMQICDDIASGHQLSSSLTTSNLFPNMVIQMISVGEASGALTDMLNKVADYYEDEVNNIVDNLSNLLEPIVMAVLGIIIGGFVVAMYLPIFKIGGLF